MKTWLFPSLLFILGVLFYTMTLRGVNGTPSASQIKKNYDHSATPFESSHERGPYVLILSLVQNHSFGFNQSYASVANPDVGYYNGKYFIFFPPGMSLLSIPLFLLGQYFNLGQVGAFLTVALFSAGTLVFLFKICRNIFKLPIWTSLLAALTFGFASIAWSYAVTIYQHNVTTFIIISSFYAVWKYKQSQKFSWAWGLYVWISYAASFFVDYPNALLMLPVIAYFILSSINIFRQRNKISVSLRLGIVFTSIAFIIITALHGYYNYKNFGSPTRLSGSLVGYGDIQKQQLLKQKTTANLQVQAAKKANPVKFFYQEYTTTGLYELFFSIDRGIFIYSPIFILAFIGIIVSIRQISIEGAVLISLALVDIFLYSSFGDPYGGWAFGPRYMIPAMAPLSIFVALWLNKMKNTIPARITTFFFFAVSSAIALLGALTTNLIPPKIEAVPLNLRYDFLFNYDYLKNGITGDFVYNQFLSSHMPLTNYYLILYEIVLVIIYCVLFILPTYLKHES